MPLHETEHKVRSDASCVPRRYLLEPIWRHARSPKRILSILSCFHPICCKIATIPLAAPFPYKLLVIPLKNNTKLTKHPENGSLATRLATLQQVVRGATKKKAALVGASKTQPEALLRAAIGLGLSDFGENRVQEAQEKWPALKTEYPAIRLHLIGPLQSNKAEDAVALFDVIHTIDRLKITDALAAACKKAGKHPQFLVQVNTGEEPQKAGVTPRDVKNLVDHCRALGLNVVGLMCVPPAGINPAPHFALLAKMARELGLSELSMGMSDDYEVALRLGATMIRVGTALFGERG